MSGLLAGIDIGGTKCTVSLGREDGASVVILARSRFSTPATPDAALDQLIAALKALLTEQSAPLELIGISCGGPLDSRRGLVLSPPNLPSWVNIPVAQTFQEAFAVPASLQNDANAGALAEWLWGAGRGFHNVVFLTFGTGMGAGLILDGRLYSGTNDMAGEVGHIRLSDNGPIGFGKAGSFEGWCSGGGIQRLATAMALDAIRAGRSPSFCPTEADVPQITTEKVALSDDPLAHEIFTIVGRRLGLGLAILIDVLNPQRILIGSIYGRQRARLDETMWAVLREEALSYSLRVGESMPCGLGESSVDYAALAVAQYGAMPVSLG